MNTTIVWVRRDFRLSDNRALRHGADAGGVVPVYIHAPEEDGDWRPGAASSVWLHHALGDFDQRLQTLGSRLILRSGASLETLRALVREVGASAVVWNRRYEPAAVATDARVKAALREDGLTVESFGGALLTEPTLVRNRQGGPYKVFTPFWKHCTSAVPVPSVTAAPERLRGPKRWPSSQARDELALLPRHDWHQSLMTHWQVGEAGATAAMDAFGKNALEAYAVGRDQPGIAGVSRMSPCLHFGHVSPAQVHTTLAGRPGAEPYLRQLYWRDFAHHLLFHFPATPQAPLNPDFARFPWRDGAAARTTLRAWQRGLTGYPLIDAGMRELWHTGWMHNRVRMNVASFLVKHLLLHWHEGARWFWDTLVDASLANNTMGWQWAAGCGADAAPYFRIFNPTLQGQRFDEQGDYVRRWVPELAALPPRFIHAPSLAPAQVLRSGGVRLGKTYPEPIVEHAGARKAALDALATLKR